MNLVDFSSNSSTLLIMGTSPSLVSFNSFVSVTECGAFLSFYLSFSTLSTQWMTERGLSIGTIRYHWRRTSEEVDGWLGLFSNFQLKDVLCAFLSSSLRCSLWLPFVPFRSPHCRGLLLLAQTKDSPLVRHKVVQWLTVGRNFWRTILIEWPSKWYSFNWHALTPFNWVRAKTLVPEGLWRWSHGPIKNVYQKVSRPGASSPPRMSSSSRAFHQGISLEVTLGITTRENKKINKNDVEDPS